MSVSSEDLDLLLSLQDKVLETPPLSPTSDCKDNGKCPGKTSTSGMSAFRDTVKDYLAADASVRCATRSKASKSSRNPEIEKLSGIHIKDPLFSNEDIHNRLSDARFIPVQAIRNLVMDDMISGHWATVGILVEKKGPRVTSAGKSFSIWNIGNLDESVASLFLFGDACIHNLEEKIGAVIAVFNSNIRKNAQGFSLNVSSSSQVVKLGTSADIAICKGKRKDGLACTAAINKRNGSYCKYHYSQASQKYSTVRTELMGGNLKTAFRDHLKSKGIYMVNPLADVTNINKATKPIQVLSVKALKHVLSNVDKVTTIRQSQGVRFLKEVTGKLEASKLMAKSLKHNQQIESLKRRGSTRTSPDTGTENHPPESKRAKKQTELDSQNLIELDLLSTDDDD